MSKGINKCHFIGNLGADPETRYGQNGNPVTNFSIAISETWKDKNTGQQQERTEWIRIVTFNRLAEVAGEYLRKGSKVYIEGQLRTRKWQDQEGQDRYTTEIVAKELQMLDPKTVGNAMTADRQATPLAQAASGGSNHGGKTAADFDDDSDRIPF